MQEKRVSLCSEDVFALYERNRNIYNDCNRLGREKECKYRYNEKCYCMEVQNVLPFTIGDAFVPCSIKRKCYINPNESCPICLECISHKQDAFLTSCGHSFHKKCILYFYEQKQILKYGSLLKCPMCRTNVGILNFGERYNYQMSNAIDRLENFWLLSDYIPGIVCRKSGHYLGFDKNCNSCMNFRKYGSYDD